MRYSKTSSITGINKRIAQYLKANNIPPLKLAKDLKLTPSAIYVFLESPSCDVDRLWEISQKMEYNFFEELATEMNIPNPPNEKIASLENELADKNKQIDQLKEVIRIMSGK